jgi:hypothetical protein
MVRGRAVCFARLLLSLFFISSSAFAQRVLVLRPQPTDATLFEAFGRLRAELQLDAFEVVVLESNGSPIDPAGLELEAQKSDAFAAIALTRLPDGAIANVSIVDRVTGKTSQRRLSIDGSTDTPTLLAVRAVDLLRASLRELDPGEKPPAEVVGVDPGPTPQEVRNFSEEPSHFQLSAGALALGVASEVGGAYGVALAAEYRPIRAVAVGLLAAGPLVGATYTANQGAASLRQELGLVRGFINVLAESSQTVELGPVLGAGVYHLEAHGEVDPPLVSESDEVWSFAASGGVEAELHLTAELSLQAQVFALLLTPRPAVAVAAESAKLASPLLCASAGLGVAF